jgi:hypothetical protein
MEKIIEFPHLNLPDEPPLPPVTISASADQMLALILSQLLQLQASVDSTATLIADVLLAVDEDLDPTIEQDVIQNQKEVIENYWHTRRSVLRSLCSELQVLFPPKKDG